MATQKTTEEVATKIRVDLKLEERRRLSEPTITVREKYKPLREIKNPDYNPNRRRT